MKKRLLVTTSTYPRFRGDTIPDFVEGLCVCLADRFDIDVLVPNGAGVNPDELRQDVRVIHYRYAPRCMETLAYEPGILPSLRANPLLLAVVPLFLLGQWIAVRRQLRRRRYDVLHAHWAIPQGIVARVSASPRRRPPILCTMHGSDLYGLKGPVFDAMRRWLSRGCAHIAVVSGAMREALSSRGIPEDRISVAPMGVDLQSEFVLNDPVGDRPAGSIVCVGRLNDQKGVDVLIRAFASLNRTEALQGRALTLDIVGDGPEREALEALSESEGVGERVRFHGSLPREALPAMYARSAICVLPSYREGLGLVLVEAAGCGCALVASDLPAVHDIVMHEQSGLLCPAGDVRAFGEALQRLILDPELRKRMANAGRQHVLERFAWEPVSERYATLLTELADGS